MKRKWRHWALCVLLALGSTAAAWSLSGVRFFQILNLKAYDAHFVLRSLLQGPPTISNIVLLVEDQKTFDTFSEPRLFWHKHYADAIRAASEAGAKVIGLDHAFGIPVDKWEPDYDRLIGESLSASAAPVVYGYVTELNSNQAEQSMPINMIAAGLGLGAFANLTADADDFVRRQELIEGPSKNPADPPPARSFALRIAEKYLGVDAEVQDDRLVLAKSAIPISADRTLAINYAGPPGTFPRYSLADFEAAAKAGDNAKLRTWVNGKIVLIGIDFADEDRKATPFYTLFSGPKWTHGRRRNPRQYDPHSARTSISGAGAGMGGVIRADSRDFDYGLDRYRADCFARGRVRAAGGNCDPGGDPSGVRRRLYSFDLRDAAGYVPLPDRVGGLSVWNRGKRPQSFPPRHFDVRRQAIGDIAG